MYTFLFLHQLHSPSSNHLHCIFPVVLLYKHKIFNYLCLFYLASFLLHYKLQSSHQIDLYILNFNCHHGFGQSRLSIKTFKIQYTNTHSRICQKLNICTKLFALKQKMTLIVTKHNDNHMCVTLEAQAQISLSEFQHTVMPTCQMTQLAQENKEKACQSPPSFILDQVLSFTQCLYKI